MIIYEDSKVNLFYDPAIASIVWTPLQYMKGAEWQIPFTKAIEFLEKQIITTSNISWINDARKLKIVSLDDLSWLNKNVNDRCFQIGIRNVAFVLPENVFGKMAVEFYVEFTNRRSDLQFQIKAFAKYDTAVKWITNTSVVK